MEEQDKNINEEDFFKKASIPFEKSKEEIWDIISDKINEQPVQKEETKIISMAWVKVAVAAMIVCLVGIPSFMKMYTITETSSNGEYFSCELPDGSEVELNAGTSLSYAPYWWSISRSVKLEGEAFFEVQKGKRFVVESVNGSTEVLGTSFNISTRNDEYKVLCATGKVKVTTPHVENEIILLPNDMAHLDAAHNFVKTENNKLSYTLGWMDEKFNFKSVSLKAVFEELERQYDIKINTDVKDVASYSYTGYFVKNESVDFSLELICKSFGFKFIKKDVNTYNVVQVK